MLRRDGVCSYSKPATFGGLWWIRVPDAAEEGDSADEQEEIVEKAAVIRRLYLSDLQSGTEQRRRVCQKEVELRQDEWRDRCKKRGFDDGKLDMYVKYAHFEFELE